MLEQLVQAASTRPLDPLILSKARDQVVQTQSEATLVEAAAAIGVFELFTKISQGTRRPALPVVMTGIMRYVLAIIRFFYEFFFRSNL